MSWTVDGLSYDTRKKLTIDQTKIDADLADFPVTVILSVANFDFAKANADGFDIRFTTSDGSTLCKYEREIHDGSAIGVYHVKVPSVAGASDTDFYMYYRTTDTADGADPTNVWDANFIAVYHGQDATTSTLADSTSNGKTLTKRAANNPLEATGQVYKGQDFEATNTDYATTAAEWAGGLTAMTAECIAKLETTGAYHTLIGSGEEGGGGYGEYNWMLQIYTDNTLRGTIQKSTDFILSPLNLKSTGAIGASFKYCAMKWDGSNGHLRLDGAQDGTTAGSGTMNNSAGGTLHIGAQKNGPSGYRTALDGVMDEIRISNDDRSDAWLKATYNTLFDTLLTYGSEETPSATFISKITIM